MSDTLKEYIRLVLKEAGRNSLSEGSVPEIWFHGSPYGNMNGITDFKRPIMFLTDSKKALPGAGKRVDGAEAGSVVYTIRLKFGTDQIFDTRNPEHLELFFSLAKLSRETGDDSIRKSDLVRVHAAPGSSISGEFPSFGIASALLQMLAKEGFVAAFIGEGSQGTSLAVWRPQQHLEIVETESLQEAWWEEQYHDATFKNLELDKPGTIVEPDVRRQVGDYLKKMGLLQGKLSKRPKSPKRKTRLK